MSITITQIPFGRSGEKAIGQQGWSRVYSRRFQAITTDKTIGQAAVLAAFEATVATIGAAYATATESDSLSFLQRIRVDEDDAGDGCGWFITADYGPFDPTNQPENPLDEPPEVDGEGAQFEEIADQDRDGNPIVNSAGDPFDPPLTKDDSRPVVRVVRNEPTFSLALAYQYRDKVNGQAWLGAEPRTVKAAPVKFRRLFHPTCGFYFQVAYEFAFNPKGWTRRPLDAGLRQKVDGAFEPIKDKGEPVSAPVPLDGAGQALAADAEPQYLEFEVYEEIDFSSAFNLDVVLGPIFA